MLGASGLAVIAAPAANAADALPTSVTGSVAPTRPGDSATMSVVLGFALSTDTPAATGVLRARLLSGPVGADGTTAASIGADTVTTAAVRGIATAVDTTAYTVTAPLTFTPNNAGTYQLLVWYDATNAVATAQYPAAATPQGVVSFTTAGQPRTIAWTSAAKTGSTDTATATIFNFTLKDANGNTTYLKTGENITGSVADSSGASGTIYAADTTTVFGAGAAAYSTPFGVAVAKATAPSGNIGVVASAAGTVTVSAVGTGLLSGLVPAATATLTTRAEIYATKFKITNTASITTVDNARNSTDAATLPVEQAAAAAGTVYASRSKALEMNFRVTAAAAGTVRATIAAIDTVTLLPSGVTAGTQDVTIASDGATAPTYTGTLKVTATAATAGSGYVISVPVTASTVMKYTVIYKTPSASNTTGYVSVKPSGDNVATIVRVLQGGTTNFTATVYDQFADTIAGASVTWTVSGRNAGISSSITNASGVATLDLKDVSTATLTASPTDQVDAQAASAAAAAFTVVNTPTTSRSIVRYGASVTAATLTLANDAPTAATYRLIDSATVLTATAKDSSGVGIAGIGVTFTLPDGAYTTTTGASTTVYTNGSGVATLSVKSTKTGVNSAGASGGGVTATASTWTVQNQAALDPRTVSLAPATVEVAGGAIVRVVATVKDRYGNPVSGVTVTPSYAGTAGRIQAVGGAIASTGTTGTDGTVGIDLSAIGSESGTGTLTAAITGGDATADGSTMGNAATIPARAASATAAVTVKAGAAAATTDAAVTAVKADVKAVSDTVATLSKAVTTIQSSVTELSSTFAAQIKSLSSAIAKISKAIAALSKRIK